MLAGPCWKVFAPNAQTGKGRMEVSKGKKSQLTPRVLRRANLSSALEKGKATGLKGIGIVQRAEKKNAGSARRSHAATGGI